jgi:hypothetical protein
MKQNFFPPPKKNNKTKIIRLKRNRADLNIGKSEQIFGLR